VVDTNRRTRRDFSTRPEIVSALQGKRSTGIRTSHTLGTKLLYVAIPIESGGKVHGALRITLETRDIDAQISQFWWRLAAIAAVVIVTVCILGSIAARSISLPIRRLNDAARRYGQGDLDTPPPTDHGPPEVRELATSMSAMATNLALMIDEQRAFVADASHQLRTPLTAMRLRLENLQEDLNVAERNEVDFCMDEIDRLSILVKDLLQMAKADRPSAIEIQNLSEIAAQRVELWAAVADSSQVSIVLEDTDKRLMCVAVGGAVEQIIDNLLDNAIGHSPQGTSVRIHLSGGRSTGASAGGGASAGVGRAMRNDPLSTDCAEFVTLTISDQGPGLSDDDKTKALRRFWRANHSRPGSGLGLSIVDELATSSGGRIHLSDNAGGGLSVTIQLKSHRDQ